MKRIFFITITILINVFLFAEDNTIVIDNTKHEYEDNFLVTNKTLDEIAIEIFVQKHEDSPWIKVGEEKVPAKEAGFLIKTKIDDDFDYFDFIIVIPIGTITDYKVECKKDNIIFTINKFNQSDSKREYVKDSNIIVSEKQNVEGYKNALMLENINYEWRDYVKVNNTTTSSFQCRVFGIEKESGDEIFIGQGEVSPLSTKHIETYYDKLLAELKAIKFTSDAIIEIYEVNNSLNDLNLIVKQCTGGKDAISFEIENEYDNKDVIVLVVPEYSSDSSKLLFNSFNVIVNNNSNKIIKIKFDESSITSNGRTGVPFIDGQKYIDAGSPPANKILPKGTMSKFSLYSSNQISLSKFGRNWNISPLGEDV